MAAGRKKTASNKDEKLLAFARECYDEAAEYWNPYRLLADEWASFLAGDQWPQALRALRENDVNGARPCLTMDRTGQYVRQVLNDARQNRSGISVRQASASAHPKAAEVLQDHVRYLEYVSRAHLAYDHALKHSAALGLGWFRLVPVVVDESRNIQELRIRRVPNWRSVLSDDWSEPDGSDMGFCFITESMRKKRFEKEYPNVDTQGWEGEYPRWIESDRIMIAEFLHVCDGSEDYVILEGGEAMTVENFGAMYPDEMQRPEVRGENLGAKIKYVEWCKLTANAVLSKTRFPSKYIPVIPVIGNEFWVDDKRCLDGMVKWSLDAQRAYNYARSSDVEVISLAPKVPWVGYEGQFEGHTQKWQLANRANIPYLEAKPITDSAGAVLPLPRREQPPVASGWQSQAMISAGDIEAGLGMYKAAVGAPSNERSGTALRARRAESDTSTFHYLDNLGISIAHAGRIIVETAAQFNDTQRAIGTLSRESKVGQAFVNPTAQAAHTQAQNGVSIVNLGLGKYDVAVEQGPNFATKKEESVAAMTELARGNPQLVQMIGDLMVRAMDWPDAERIADRLQAMLPPAIQQIEAASNDPEAMKAKLLMAMQKGQQQDQIIQQMQQHIDELAQKAENEDGKLDVQRFDAQTKRLKAIETGLSPEDVQQLVVSTIQQILAGPESFEALGQQGEPQDQGQMLPDAGAMPFQPGA